MHGSGSGAESTTPVRNETFRPENRLRHDISDLVTQAGTDFGASRFPALNLRLAGTHHAGGPQAECPLTSSLSPARSPIPVGKFTKFPLRKRPGPTTTATFAHVGPSRARRWCVVERAEGRVAVPPRPERSRGGGAHGRGIVVRDAGPCPMQCGGALR